MLNLKGLREGKENLKTRICEPHYLWVYEQVYSFKNILRRIPRSLKQVPAYLMFNFFYRKWGRFTDWLCKKITYERIGYWGERLSKYI